MPLFLSQRESGQDRFCTSQAVFHTDRLWADTANKQGLETGANVSNFKGRQSGLPLVAAVENLHQHRARTQVQSRPPTRS